MSFGQAWLKWQQRMVCGNIARHGVRKIESLVQFPARFEEINLLGPAGEYHRQVVSSLSGLSEHPCPSGQQRVLEYRSAQDAGSMKSAQGHLVFREAVAESLRRRDALVTDPDDILFFDDFIQAATFGLSLWSEGDSSYAVMVPFPGFPLARACANANGRVIPYFLEKGFGYMGDITMATLQRTIEIIASTARPRVLILQNPGPTGQLLSLESLQRCLEFAAEHSLVIFAQEDDSMLHDKTFVSCRHVAAAMDLDVPVMTCFAMEDLDQIGACGSFIHLQRASSFLPAELTSSLKTAGVDAQAWISSLLTGISEDSLSHEVAKKHCQRVREVLSVNATMAESKLNDDGISCEKSNAGTHIFAQMVVKGFLMKKAISLSRPADDVYCSELLVRTGLSTTPGCSYGQRPGTFHFRMSMLHSDSFELALDEVLQFHREHPHGWFSHPKKQADHLGVFGTFGLWFLWFGALVLGTLLFQRLCFAELAFFFLPFGQMMRAMQQCSNVEVMTLEELNCSEFMEVGPLTVGQLIQVSRWKGYACCLYTFDM